MLTRLVNSQKWALSKKRCSERIDEEWELLPGHLRHVRQCDSRNLQNIFMVELPVAGCTGFTSQRWCTY